MAIKLQGTNSVAAPGLTNDGGDGVVVGTDSVDISIGGASKVKIDSSGRVGLGTTSVAKNDHSVLNVHSGTAGVYQYFTDSATGTGGDDGLTLGLDTSQNGMIWHRENKDIRIGTNANERLRVLAGGGLTFNGDTAADNALDDYEVGTFAAQVNDANITSSYTTAFYVKIGDLVNVTINMTCTATSGSGVVSFPLPFAVGNNITNGNKVYGGSATNMHTQVNFSTNYTTLAAHTWYGQTNVFMYQTGGGQTWSALNATHLTANQTGWVIDFCYSVA